MIKFLYNNKVEGASLSASTENAQYPLSNLQHDFRTKVYRSTSNSDSVVFDLGAIEDVDYIALVDNWKNGFGITACTIQANATDSWGSPAFSTTITLDTTFGIGIKELASTESYRYWRLVLTSTLGYCELAHVFIGQAESITTNGVSYGFNYTNKDLMKMTSTRYGQEYIDDIGTRKSLDNLAFQVMSTSELDQIFNVFDNRRTVKPFILKMGDGTNTMIGDEDRLNGLYKFDKSPSAKMRTASYWDITLSVMEQK